MADPEQSEASASPSTKAQYTCVCKEGFYIPNETIQGFPSDKVELASSNYSCTPCPGGCLCDKDGNCLFGEEIEEFFTETLLRAIIGAVLGACMLCCLMMSLVVFRQRKCKVCACSCISQKTLTNLLYIIWLQTIASGMWTILETILVGIVLLYAAVSALLKNKLFE